MDAFAKYSKQCVDEFGAPQGFTVFEAGLVGGDGKPGNFTHVQMRGAVYQPVTRGKRKGEPNWRKPVEGTKREFFIPLDRKQP